MGTNPVRTGGAFALTAALGYGACALVFWLFPHGAAAFMSALFHGLDFARLQSEPGGFSFRGFAGALAVVVVWAFFLGAVFSLVHERLGRP